MAWTYEFDDYGGYNCMTAGFRIFDSKGHEICVIDVKDFAHVEPQPEIGVNRTHPDYQQRYIEHKNACYEWDHRRSPAAERVAKMICARCDDV